MKHLLLVTIFFVLARQSFSLKNYENYFYWRHFSGSIPEDAIIGGDTCKGDPTYIGSTLFLPNGLLPSTIYINDSYAYSHTAGIERKSDTVTKILCADPKHPPVWKPIHIDNPPKNCYFIEGGSELGYPLFIGRIGYKGLTYTGKVYPTSSFFKGLDVWADRYLKGIQQFDILAYCDENEEVESENVAISSNDV